MTNVQANVCTAVQPGSATLGTNSLKLQIKGPIYLKRRHSKISSNLGPNILKQIIKKYIYWALILAERKNKYIGSHFWSL